MKALFTGRRSVLHLALTLLLLLAGAATVFHVTASVAAAGHTGQALALRAAMLRPGFAETALSHALMAQKGSASGGRFVYPRAYYKGRAAGLHPNDASNGNPVSILEGVQTYDVFAPPANFLPGDGPLTPTNLEPTWTSDGNYIIFSSNRRHLDPSGTMVDDGTFHLWSISESGDNPLAQGTPSSLHQITTSTGNEFFPTIYTPTNSQLAFTSSAGNGTQNLYAITSNFDASATFVNVNNLASLTIRNAGSPNDLVTHFAEVDRPTWSPAGDRLIFSAVDSDGTFGPVGPTPGIHHLWILYTNSGGARSDFGGPSPSNPPGKLTNGPADDTDPAWTPDSAANLIAFATNAGSFAAGASGSPATSSTPAATRAIFVVKPDATQPTKVTTSGFDDYGPAWNVNPDFTGFLTFARGVTPAANHEIDFLQTVYTLGVGAGGAPVTTIRPEGAANVVSVINTDDLPNRATGNPGNVFNKAYPSWSPFLSLEAVVYSSNRSVTYNDPATANTATGYPGNPVEIAINLPQAGLAGNGVPQLGKVGPAYTGLLISRFDDLDPPTFLPYSANENIHVTNGVDDTPRRNGDIVSGHDVKFTVRLSNREAGIDDQNVYIQIKDPDSKYQDVQGLEHKVFTKDARDYLVAPDSFANVDADAGTGATSHPVGSATGFLYNGGLGGGFSATVNSPLYGQVFNTRTNTVLVVNGVPVTTDPIVINYFRQFETLFDIGEATETFTVNSNPYTVSDRGAVGGYDGTNNISVGRDPGITGSPIFVTIGTNPPSPLGDGDPGAFKSFGQEYECQFVNPLYGAGGATDTASTDYGSPFYLAGVDDQGPHTGTAHPAPVDATNRLEWLKLTRLPVGQQDANGGILYSATWTTPTSASDYFLDVIAYDKATVPTQPGLTAANWRIYDNIWGFSTQQFSGGKDILIVSDNALGQKFVGTTFGGNALGNVPPIYYGAESYYTDIDVNLLPNAIYRHVLQTGNKPMFNPAVFDRTDMTPFNLADILPIPEVLDLRQTGENGASGNPSLVFNGLGVSSYSDPDIALKTSVIGGFNVPLSQQYSIWRTLARGPLDPTVLSTYSPTSQAQPAVDDPLTGTQFPPAVVPVNQRCVIWVSPYAQNLPLNTVGSIGDGSVQTELRAFIQGGTFGGVNFPSGGRLFVSGQNVASELAQGGNVASSNASGSFIFDVLNASFVPGTGGNQNLAGVNGRIAGDGFFNFLQNVQQQSFNNKENANGGFDYSAPYSNPLILGNNYVVFPPNGRRDIWRTDGSLSQLGPVFSTIGTNLTGANNDIDSQISSINVQNGANVEINAVGPGFDPTTGAGVASQPVLTYHIDTVTNTVTNGVTALGGGGRVVFSSIGIEGLGIEYYKHTLNNVDHYFAYNQRPNLLHNVVCFLRTAQVTGTIFAGNSGGQTLSGATVYLVPNTGTIPGAVRQTYSATTRANGTFQINGVEPGGYFLVAYKAGYTRAESLGAQQVEGDNSVSFNLNLTPLPPGAISGVVKDNLNPARPVANANLAFTSTDGSVRLTATSRADGTYTITNVPAGKYNSTVSAPGFTTTTKPDPPTPDPFTVASGQTTTNVNFTLTVIPGTIGGLAKDGFTGLPVPGATITVKNPVSGTTIVLAGNPTTTDTGSTPAAGLGGDGNLLNYVISGLTQGTYTVTITAPQYYTVSGPATVTVTVTANQFTRVPDFTLNSTLGQIGGLVQETANDAPLPGAGKTLAGATVIATDVNNSANQFTFTTTGTVTAPASPTGDNNPLNFIGSVPPGTYTVTVSAPNFTTQTFFNVVITTHNFTRVPPTGGSVDLVSTLGTLGGLVRDAYPTKTTGAAIAGANFVIKDSTGATVLTGTTPNVPTASPNDGVSGDGGNVNYYTGITLPEGDYTVTASAADFTPSTVTFHVTHHQFTRGDVPLSSTLGTVGGLVTDTRTGKPLGGASVTITTLPDENGNGATTIYSTTTAADGTTTSPAAGRYGDGNPVNFVKTLTAGKYQVTIAKQGGGTITQPDYVTQTFQINVTPDNFLRKDVTLVYAYGDVGGLIRDSFTQNLLAGATITVADLTGNVVSTVTGRNSTSSPAAPLGDGQPLNYNTNQVIYGGAGTSYVVTATATDHTTLSQKVTVIGSQFARANFDLVSRIGYVGGLVLDSSSGATVGGATVTIKDTGGAVVTTFTTAATTSSATVPAGDGKAVNYSGPLQTNADGTAKIYTATVTRRGYTTTTTQTFTIQSNQFTRVDFSGTTNGLPPIHVFGAGYSFFSVPYDYASIGVGFDDLFGSLNTGTRAAPSAGSNRSHIFVWSPQLVQYVLDPQAPADSLRLGQGYWVYLLNSHEVTVAGNATTAKSVTVSLHKGWNQIGVPSLTPIALSNLTFNNQATGGTITFADASGSTFRLVSSPLYGYNGSTYVAMTAGSSLQPWQSYWIYAFADVTVNIPTS